MSKISKVPLEKNELLSKLNEYSSIHCLTMQSEDKNGHVLVKFYNDNAPAVLRVYTTKKGLTIDGSLGNNTDLNDEIIKYINEITASKDVIEERVTVKKITATQLLEIKDRISLYVESSSSLVLCTDNYLETKGYENYQISNTMTKEKVTIRFYSNRTIYLYGFNIHLGDEVLNIISSILNRDITVKHDVLETIVHYCNENFIMNDGQECKICDNRCSGDCSKLLQEIHYGSQDRYDCSKVINYYIPKYAYRYSYEIEKLIEMNRSVIEKHDNLHVLSIGCGPATELVATLKYANEHEKMISYNGIDLNKKWAEIHEKYLNFNNERVKLRFHYQDIFEFLDSINPKRNELKSNIVIFQYVLSDIRKHKTKNEMFAFVERFTNEVIKCLPVNAVVILNDINHIEKSREIFEVFASLVDVDNFDVERYSFNPQYINYSEYGTMISESYSNYEIPDYIEKRYNPWNTCKSAAMVIRKVK